MSKRWSLSLLWKTNKILCGASLEPALKRSNRVLGQRCSWGHQHLLSKHEWTNGHHFFLGARRMCVSRRSWRKIISQDCTSITYSFPLGRFIEFRVPSWAAFTHQLVLWGIFNTSSRHNLTRHLLKIPAVLTQWKRNSNSFVFAYSVQEMRLYSGASCYRPFGYEWPKAQVTLLISL